MIKFIAFVYVEIGVVYARYPPKNIPRVGDAHAAFDLPVLWVRVPKGVLCPKLAVVKNSILSVGVVEPDVVPPPKTDLILFERPAKSLLAVVSVPKSTESLDDAIVT